MGQGASKYAGVRRFQLLCLQRSTNRWEYFRPLGEYLVVKERKKAGQSSLAQRSGMVTPARRTGDGEMADISSSNALPDRHVAKKATADVTVQDFGEAPRKESEGGGIV
jgi:hypothetical protein